MALWRWTCVCLLGALAGRAPGASAQYVPTEQAIAQFEKRVQHNPADYVSLATLAELHARRSRETGDLSHYSRAETALRRALELDPAYTPAQVQWSAVCMARHRFDEALRLATQARKESGDEPGSVAAFADACLELGKYREAESALRLLRPHVAEPAVLARLSQWAWLRGNHREAIEHLEQAVGTKRKTPGIDRPDDVAWYEVRLGHIYFRTGEFGKAEEQYQAALKAWPDSHLALDYLAELRAAQGKLDEAIALYGKIVSRVPRPELQHALGDVYQAMGKPDEARHWHHRALDLYLRSVRNGEVHYFHHLATYYSDSEENGPEAVRWAQKDLELRSSVYACEALAWAQYRNGQFAAAVGNIKKALVQGTQDAHMLYHAGQIYSRAGQIAEGRAFLKQAVAANPRYNTFHVHR